MRLLLVLGLCCYMPFLTAQITHPKASPFSRVEQEIGLSKITIEYSRPAVRGRKVFGRQADGMPGLVPYGRIWRVGANESTKFITSTNIKVGGKDLPKGTYALYAFPNEDSWEIVFHNNTTHWGDGRKAYDPKEDALRLTVTPLEIPHTQENFLITFDGIDHNSANMLWIWENIKISIPISVPTEIQMLKEIDQKIRDNPTAQTYYESARYLQEQGKEYPKALQYLRKAIQLGGDTYYFHRVKSLVEAALGDYKAAIVSATLSLDLAQKEEKDEFVRMNKKNIKKWTEQLNKQ